MAAPKGHPFYGGGRTKGTPNKSTQHLTELCEQLDCDPFKVLLLFAKGDWKALGYDSQQRICGATKDGEALYEDVITPETRQKAAKEACEYVYPKRKAVELSTEDDKGFLVVIENYAGNSDKSDG